MKIIAKIETPEALENLNAINMLADSVIFVFDKIKKEMDDKNITEEMLIKKIKDS
jgi:pyruvate kinase